MQASLKSIKHVVTMMYFHDFRCRQGELFDYLTQVVTLSEKRTRYVSSSETNLAHIGFPLHIFLSQLQAKVCSGYKLLRQACPGELTVFALTGA